jgi:hypothetical protein
MVSHISSTPENRRNGSAPGPASSHRQGLLLRMALTSAFAFLLAKHSCVARVMRALYIYKSKLWLSNLKAEFIDVYRIPLNLEWNPKKLPWETCFPAS